MSVNLRIKQIIDTLNLKQVEFADKLGVRHQIIGTIYRNTNTPNVDLVAQILTKFPQISAEWLMTGEGEMFKDPTKITTSGVIIQQHNGNGHIIGKSDKISHNTAQLTPAPKLDADVNQLLTHEVNALVEKVKDLERIIAEKEEIIKSKQEIIDLLREKNK